MLYVIIDLSFLFCFRTGWKKSYLKKRSVKYYIALHPCQYPFNSQDLLVSNYPIRRKFANAFKNHFYMYLVHLVYKLLQNCHWKCNDNSNNKGACNRKVTCNSKVTSNSKDASRNRYTNSIRTPVTTWKVTG